MESRPLPSSQVGSPFEERLSSLTHDQVQSMILMIRRTLRSSRALTSLDPARHRSSPASRTPSLVGICASPVLPDARSVHNALCVLLYHGRLVRVRDNLHPAGHGRVLLGCSEGLAPLALQPGRSQSQADIAGGVLSGVFGIIAVFMFIFVKPIVLSFLALLLCIMRPPGQEDWRASDDDCLPDCDHAGPAALHSIWPRLSQALVCCVRGCRWLLSHGWCRSPGADDDAIVGCQDSWCSRIPKLSFAQYLAGLVVGLPP